MFLGEQDLGLHRGCRACFVRGDRPGFLFRRPRFHGKTLTARVTRGIYGGDRIVKYRDFVGGRLGLDVVKGACLTALEPMSEVLARLDRRPGSTPVGDGSGPYARLGASALTRRVFGLPAYEPWRMTTRAFWHSG